MTDLFSAPAREVALTPAWAAEVERRALAPARTIGVDLPVVAVTDPPTAPIEIRRSPRGTWWVATDADADPVALTNDGVMEAPPDVIARLRALRSAGVDFASIWIAHEWPADWQPGTPPPKMQIAGPAASAPIVSAQQATFDVGKKLLAAAAGLAEKTAGAASAMAAAVAYDPVILGAVQDPQSDRIAWVVLAAWDETPR